MNNNLPLVKKENAFKSWMKKHQTGLYLTVIIHLLAFIFLTLQMIRGELGYTENVYLFDFSKREPTQEELEQQEKTEVEQKQQEDELLRKEVDEMVRQARNTPLARNVAVNVGDHVSATQSSTPTSSTYNPEGSLTGELSELQKQLEETRRQMEQLRGTDDAPTVNTNTGSKQQTTAAYKGPSVLMYSLGGRQAMYLPVPVYKCQSGGDVAVTISVNRHGYVIVAEVDRKKSTNDDCLHDAALLAARSSRFAADKTAADPQQGSIVYRFIAQ